MKKALTLQLILTMLGMTLAPAFAQNAYGQDKEEEDVVTISTEDAVTTESDSSIPMIQVQQKNKEQLQVNNDETIGIENENQNEIQKVIINRSEDDQLQVHTENKEKEQEEYQMENGEQLLLQLELNNEGTDSQLQVRKNADGDTFIEKGEAQVKANFPMEIDTETGVITITTNSGNTIELTADPDEILSTLQDNYNVDTVENYELVENDDGSVDYILTGIDKKKFLGLIEIDTPIEAIVDCGNADTIVAQIPWYLNWFGFLFSEV